MGLSNRIQKLRTIAVFILILNFCISTNLHSGLEPGKTLPAFKLPALTGGELTLEEFRGKIVIVHLWKCR